MLREIKIAQRGKVYLHSMPGRKESWSEAIQALKTHQVSHILCLTSDAEILEKSPEYGAFIEYDLKNNKLIELFIHIDIEDFSVPTDTTFYQQQICSAAKAVNQGAHLLIHCAAGIGRTGCAAIALLQELGLSPSDAQAAVLVSGSHPETQEQWDFIRSYQAKSSQC